MIKWTWLLFSRSQYCNFLLPNVHPPMKPPKPRSKPISKIIYVSYHGTCHLKILKRKLTKSI